MQVSLLPVFGRTSQWSWYRLQFAPCFLLMVDFVQSFVVNIHEQHFEYWQGVNGRQAICNALSQELQDFPSGSADSNDDHWSDLEVIRRRRLLLAAIVRTSLSQ